MSQTSESHVGVAIGSTEVELTCQGLSERLLDSLRANDAEFEESDDEDDVARQRSGAASQKRARLHAEETAPKDTAEAAPAMAIPSPLPATAGAPASPPLPPADPPLLEQPAVNGQSEGTANTQT